MNENVKIIRQAYDLYKPDASLNDIESFLLKFLKKQDLTDHQIEELCESFMQYLSDNIVISDIDTEFEIFLKHVSRHQDQYSYEMLKIMIKVADVSLICKRK